MNRDLTAPRIGASVEPQLEDTLFKLLAGELELRDLTPALASFWMFGHQDGWNARQPEIDQLQYRVGLWYFCYANKVTPADFYRRQTAALWEEGSR